MKRLTEPEDVADMAVYLASDGARMVSGQALAVDGMTYNVDP
jgi:NAD(P)-dependent dehydrogenase (short-subunit alcohol dehydrogenase family)